MQSLKIKTTLRILTTAFAVIPMLIVGIVGYFSMTGFAANSVSQFARASGAAQQEIINQYLNECISDVTYLSFSNAAGTLAQSGQGDDANSNLSLLSENVETRNSGFQNIVITDPSGNIVYEYNDIQGMKESFFGFEELENYTEGSIKVSNIYTNNEDYGTDVFYVAKSIDKDGLNNIDGFAIEVIDLSRITEILSNSTYGEGKGYLAVSDGNGCVLNYNGTAVQKIDDVSDGNMRDVFRSTVKPSSNENNVDYNTGSSLGCYNYFTGSSTAAWKWISVYPGNMSMSQIIVPVAISVGSMAVLAVICALLGILITKSIVNPMNQMVTVAREIQEGDREKRLEIKTHNEFKDISELFNNMLDDVSMSEELHRTISDISDNMLFEWDFHKESMYISDNFREKFDIDPKEAQLANGKFLDKLMSEEYAEIYKRDISTLLKNRTGHSGEYQMTTKNGSLLWFSVRALCVTDRLGEPLRVIGVVTDIDSEKKLELQLSERASYDFLSQLYNRSTFERELKSEIERSAHAKVAVLFIDVDDFKFINDRFGHSVGDEVIKYVAGCIKQRVKGSGFAGRFGGDEFVLCITDSKQIDEIESLSLDLIDELYEGYHSELANVSINVKASIGIAFFPEHGNDSNKIVAAADEAMYFVKKNGKANYHIYQPEDSQIEDLQHTL